MTGPPTSQTVDLPYEPDVVVVRTLGARRKSRYVKRVELTDELLAEAFSAFARARYGLEDSVPTELELAGIRAAAKVVTGRARADR